MSKNYLSYREIRSKIEGVTETLSTSNKKFKTKKELVAYGKCNLEKLKNYNDYDFVIDDDIVTGGIIKELSMVLHLDGYEVSEIDKVVITLTSTSEPNVTVDLTYYASNLGILYCTLDSGVKSITINGVEYLAEDGYDYYHINDGIFTKMIKLYIPFNTSIIWSTTLKDDYEYKYDYGQSGSFTLNSSEENLNIRTKVIINENTLLTAYPDASFILKGQVDNQDLDLTVDNIKNIFVQYDGTESDIIACEITNSSTGDFYMVRAGKTLNGLNFGGYIKRIDLLKLNSKYITSNFINKFTFAGCSSLLYADLTETIPAIKSKQDLSYFFRYCYNLKTIVGSLAFDDVQDLTEMFKGCYELQSVDLSKISTTDPRSVSAASMFEGCKKITFIDLSNIELGQDNDFSNMFKDCTSLQKIYFNKNNGHMISLGTNLFDNCDNLNYIKCGSYLQIEIRNYVSSTVTWEIIG